MLNIAIVEDNNNDLEKLIEYSYKNNKDIKERIAKIVSTYKIDNQNKREV